MDNVKAIVIDGIPIEVWKCMGEKNIFWLPKLFIEILKSKKMADEWRRSTLVPFC